MKKFRRLVVWEIEEYWSSPILELVIFAAVIAALYPPLRTTDFQNRYLNLGLSMAVIFIFLMFTTGTIFARSFAGSLSKGETKKMLSYPLERASVFVSKFAANFLMLFAVFAAVFSLNIPLLALDQLEPMFYVSLAAMVIQLLFLCTTAAAVSLVTRNEVVSFMAVVMLFFGVEILGGNNRLLSSAGRYQMLFNYFVGVTRGWSMDGNLGEAVLSVAFPLLASAVLFAASLVYFTRFMEID